MDVPYFRYDRHVFLPGPGMWLDSTQPRDLAFISHAHSDHTARHRRVLLTESTWLMYQHRTGSGRRSAPAGGGAVARRSLPPSQPITLDFHTPHVLGGHELELLPSGHVLGAAQLSITFGDGARLVYTGDFKLRPGPTAEAAQVPRCDVLVMETTFGHPRYRFPPPDQVREQLVTVITRCLENGRVPVVLAYSLGKAQEATRLLTDHGFRVAAHPAVAAINRLYEQRGTALGPWEPLGRRIEAGAVLVAPPDARHGWQFSRLQADQHLHTIMLTGWAIDSSACYRYRVDDVVPLSDHADWDELVQYVEQAQPRAVYTLHGFPEFASYLRSRGIEATHLPPHQPPLMDSW